MSTQLATPDRPELTVVLPVYNNAESLLELLVRICVTIESAAVRSYEIICVDDGSADASRRIVAEACREDARIKLISLSRNFGHQFAITAGLDHSRGEAVLVMDADLQDPPEVIPDFLAQWRAGFDVVYGVRLARPGDSRFKRGTAAAFYRILQRLTRTPIPADSGDFRLMSRRAVDTFSLMRERARFVRGMVSWIGYPQTPVLYQRQPRAAGESQYTLAKLIRLAVDGILSFSDAPLRLITGCGFAGVFVSLLYFAYAVAQRLLHGIPVEGWTSLVGVVIFMGSAQLLMLGVIGQYIARIYEESKARPLYIVQESVGFPGQVQPLESERVRVP
jgi:glycosyltransferase involved in cell wall biosynthesis